MKFSEIIASEKPTLVDFYAEWCGPCKMMSPILDKLKAKWGDEIRIIKVDVDKNEAASRAYQIQSVPTLMIFQRGQLKWRKSGVPGIAELEQLLSQYQKAV